MDEDEAKKIVADVFVDTATTEQAVKVKKDIRGFYDILRARIDERIEGTYPEERLVLEWVLEQIDECEDIVDKKLAEQIEEMRAKIKNELLEGHTYDE